MRNAQLINTAPSLFFLALVFFFAPLAASATMHGCQPGEVPATAADVVKMKANGIASATVGMCWNPNDKAVGQDVGQAKQELEQMWCGGRAATCTYQGTTYTSTIEGLDPSFAICANKMMKILRQSDPTACIRSAFRSAAHQVCACGGNAAGTPGKCAPAGSSYHQKGLAVDITTKLSNQQLWQSAGQSGLGNPPGLNVSDPTHIQPIGGATNCATAGYTPADTSVIPQSRQTPTQNLMSGLQNFFSPPAVPQCAAGSILLNGTCVPQDTQTTQSPFYYATSATPVSNSINPDATSSANTQTPAIDMINAIANPTTTAATTTSAPGVALNGSLAYEAVLHGTQVTQPATSSSYVPPRQPPQTFTSQDLSQTPVRPAQNTTFSLLENIRQTLLAILSALRPFGGTTPQGPRTPPGSSVTAFL